MFRGRARDDAVVRQAHAQALHVRAEATFAVMVLTVHVAGDHAAERHELGSGCDRREPTPRDEQTIELRQAEARLGAHHPRRSIELEDAVGEPRRDHSISRARGQRRVSVRATEAARESRAARGRFQILAQLLPTRYGDASPTTQRGGRRIDGDGRDTLVLAGEGRGQGQEIGRGFT